MPLAAKSFFALILFFAIILPNSIGRGEHKERVELVCSLGLKHDDV